MRGRSPLIFLVAAAALAFFFTPAIAYVTGTRGRPIENRPPTAFPNLIKNRFNSFPVIDQWSLDRLPLRPNAVKARIDVTRSVFGELPDVTADSGPVGAGQTGNVGGATDATNAGTSRAEQVLLGRHGWLFLGEEFTRACAPDRPRALVAAGIVRLARMLRASGRRLVITVAPDKDDLSGEFLPADLPERSCAEKEKAARRALLAALPPDVGYVDVQSALQREQARTGKPIYLREDTHWTDLGAEVYVRAMMRALQPDLLKLTAWAPRPEMPYVGDLSAKAGEPVERLEPAYALLRTGVTTTPLGARQLLPGFGVRSFRSSSPPDGAKLYRPPTVLYGDSFTQRTEGEMFPFFRHVTRVDELARAALVNGEAAGQDTLIEAIVHSQTLMAEVAERIFWGTAPGSIVLPSFLDRLQAALKTAPPPSG